MVPTTLDEGPLALVGQAGETLSTMAYNSLREMIVYGDLTPGERLYPVALAARFSISPTPVKEAFTRLHAEGLLQAVPRRGYTVMVPTPQRTTEFWQVRRGLELTAGELVIWKLNDGTLAEPAVDTLDERLDHLSVDGSVDHRRHIELNAAFHLALVELAGNSSLTAIYESTSQHTFGAWVQTGLSSWRDRLVSEEREHRSIVAAIRGRDEDGFREALSAHLKRSLRDAIRDLSSKPTVAEGRKR